MLLLVKHVEFSFLFFSAHRAVRDLVYRSPTVHPIIAADAFEIWENVHAAETPRPDDDTVVISGARTADGTSVPQETVCVCAFFLPVLL